MVLAPPSGFLTRCVPIEPKVMAAYCQLGVEDGLVNEHPSFSPRHDPRHRSPTPTWRGIVVSISSLLAAITVIAIGRGWL